MKKHFGLFILLFISSEINSQPFGVPPNNTFQKTVSTFYFEVGGNAVFASLNYDLIFDSKYGVRIGISPGLLFIDSSTDNNKEDYNYDLTALISAFKLYGSASHKVETGLGALFGEAITPRENKYPAVPALFLNFGYRFSTTKEKGLSFRLMFTPSINKNGITPWCGASIGISFKNKIK